MSRLIDLTGQQFGYLTVIKNIPLDGRVTYSKWLCRCICGNEKEVRGNRLKNGETRSCGCKTYELRNEARNKSVG